MYESKLLRIIGGIGALAIAVVAVSKTLESRRLYQPQQFPQQSQQTTRLPNRAMNVSSVQPTAQEQTADNAKKIHSPALTAPGRISRPQPREVGQ